MALTHLNFTMAFWYFMLGVVVVWRQIMKIDRLQRIFHQPFGGCMAFCFQWYFVFYIGVGFATGYSLWELLIFYDTVPPTTITANLEEIFHRNVEDMADNVTRGFRHGGGECNLPSCEVLGKEQFLDTMHIEPWLRYLSVSGQVAAIGTVAISFTHVFLILRKFAQHSREHEKWKKHHWKPTTRLNWLLWVFTMPAVFSVASLRAGCRVWSLLTGTAQDARHHNEGCRWAEVEEREFSLYTSDLELAALFQFMTVYGFCQLMGELVSHIDVLDQADDRYEEQVTELQYVVKRAGFMGAWAFILIGFVRTLVSFVCVELSSLGWAMDELQENVDNFFALLFTATTVLCVINMFIICHMKSIKDKIPKANPKFLGTRILLLCGEVQKRILSAFTWGSPMFLQVHEILVANQHFTWKVHTWKFNRETAQLAHCSLLTWEAFFVVLANFLLWQPWNCDVEKMQLTPAFEARNRMLLPSMISRKINSQPTNSVSNERSGASSQVQSRDGKEDIDPLIKKDPEAKPGEAEQPEEEESLLADISKALLD